MFRIHSGIIDSDSEYCDHCQLQQVFYVLDNVQTNMNNGLTVGQAGGASISRSVCFEWSG